MKPDEQLDRILQDLRAEHFRQQRPPLDIEKMEVALRPNRQLSKQRRILGGIAAAAASISLLAYLHPFRTAKLPESEAVVPLATFVSLPSGATLPPSSNTTYVCVRLHKEDLREFGIDIPETDANQIVQAEFLLGEDGLARAVRLVGASYRSGNQPAVVRSR